MLITLFFIVLVAMCFFAKFLDGFYGWNLSQVWLINLAGICTLIAWSVILMVRWAIRKRCSFGL